MAAIVVIPARFGSTRFPAKILAADTGRPLVQHVVDQVRKCRLVKDVDGLYEWDPAKEGPSPRRFASVNWIHALTLDGGIVQGDEPEIEPSIVDALINRLESTTEDMATAATPFPVGAAVADSNLVKVVTGIDGRAIYFSRSVIPHHRDQTSAAAATYYLHLGIYAYRRPFLLEFASWKPTPLEMTEKLEQLRALEHGRSIGE